MCQDGTVVSDTAGALRGRLSAGRGLSALEAGESRGRDKMDESSAPGGEHGVGEGFAGGGLALRAKAISSRIIRLMAS